MRAAVFHEAHQPMTIETIEVANPGPHEVLLNTAYAGLCHSDLHFLEGLYPIQAPAILGHESSAVVAASSPATGASGTAATVTTTRPTSVRAPSDTV